MKARRVAALGRYALANNLRTPHTWVGFALLAAIALLGAYTRYRSTGAWTLHHRFLANGTYIAAVFVLRSGIVAQREGGLQTFLRSNLTTPGEHVAGAVASLLGAWMLVTAAAFLAAFLIPGAGFRLAGWHAWTLALQVGLLLPFVLLTELVSAIEVPLLVPGLTWVVLFMAAYTVFGADGILWINPPTQPGSFASTAPLIVRLAMSCGVGFGAVLTGVVLWNRRA